MSTGEVSETMDPADHYTTYGGSPFACAAANATLEVIDQEKLLEKAASVGAEAFDHIAELREDHELNGDVPSKGLHIGQELVDDRET